KADITYVDDEIKELKDLLIEKIQENEGIITEFKEEITEQLANSFLELNETLNKHKKDVNNSLDNLSKHVPKNHVNSDHFSTLQEAIYNAENGVLHVKKGTY